jgi:ribosomal peptide maturation radical SAM protein 1
LRRESPLSVALVYPPFGPAGLPSLGLSLLCSSIRALGVACRTYYWNLRFQATLPGNNMAAQSGHYWWLTGRAWYPFSEWTFARVLYDDGLAHREPLLLEELRQRAATLRDVSSFGACDLLRIRDRADDLIAEMVEELDPYDIVGIGTTFYQNLPALALARRLKQRRPKRPVILGGANCDGEMGPGLFRNFIFLDHLFVGESDGGFPEYVRRVRDGEGVDDVPGILARTADGGISTGPEAPPVQHLDELPLPDFDDFVEQRERYGIEQPLTLALESSRGCWWGARHHCVFCGLNANGMAYRRKSAERFQWEMAETVRRYAPKHLFMTDNILPVEYYDGFLTWAKAARLGVSFFYEIKANAKRTQVARMADAGMTAVQPGIESFSSKLLTLMRKGVSASQNVAFLKYAREYGVRPSYNLLVGFPGAGTPEYVRMLSQLPSLFHLRPPSSVVPVEYHRFSPYHQQPAEFGLQLVPAEEYRHLYPFDAEELSRIAYRFCDTGDSLADPVLIDLDATVREWQSLHRTDDCTLTWHEGPLEIEIEDRRPTFGPKRIVLRRFAMDLFRLLDEPHSLSGLLRVAASIPHLDGTDLLAYLFEAEVGPDVELIRFDVDDFLALPGACLRMLLDAGLLFEDAADPEPRYVALPVRATWRAEDPAWDSIGV